MAIEIIAEVGECFNGSLNTAKEMIQKATEAGCNCVKFQILDMEEVATDDPEYDWFSKIELTKVDIEQLISCADKNGIDTLFTPVSIRTAEFLVELGVKKVKIASSFLRKLELMKYINSNFEKVYMSTGMASLDEIKKTKELLNKINDLTILHCVSEYRTGPLLEQRGLKALSEEDAHLNMINILKETFPDVSIGYSDHTDGVFVPMIAASMGVTTIEKHFTLDRQTPIDHFNNGEEYMGTDHVLSVEPDKLKEMVRLIRRVERCQGTGEWERSEGEKILINFLRGRYTERE